MNRNKAIITILTIIILVLILVIAFLIYSESDLDNEVSGSNFANPITEDDLKEGVKCKVMMQSSIYSGVNTDDQGLLYGGVEIPTPPDPSFGTSDYSYFYLNLNDQGQLIKRYPASEEGVTFQIIKNSSNNDKWYSAEATSDKNYGNGRILELFFFSDGEFRSTIIYFSIGHSMTIMRGGCAKEA